MANRHTLHISKLAAFREFLLKDGWEIEEPKGTYEVLRARKHGRKNPLIVYRKLDSKEHLSLMDRDSSVVRAFIRDYSKPKTNAYRIRSISDEELAEWLTKITDDAQLDAATKCNYQWKEWLQSEAE